MRATHALGENVYSRLIQPQVLFGYLDSMNNVQVSLGLSGAARDANELRCGDSVKVQ
jgi:hypothetical protein